MFIIHRNQTTVPADRDRFSTEKRRDSELWFLRETSAQRILLLSYIACERENRHWKFNSKAFIFQFQNKNSCKWEENKIHFLAQKLHLTDEIEYECNFMIWKWKHDNFTSQNSYFKGYGIHTVIYIYTCITQKLLTRCIFLAAFFVYCSWQVILQRVSFSKVQLSYIQVVLMQ